MSFERDLDLYIMSSYPILYVPTYEEERVEELIRRVAKNGMLPRAVHFWNFLPL